MACPACSAVSAMPHSATTMPEGATRVGMRCRQCGHQWSVDQPAAVELPKLRSGVRLPIAQPPKVERE